MGGFSQSTGNIVIFCELALFSGSLGDTREHIANGGAHKKIEFSVFQRKVCSNFHEQISFLAYCLTFLQIKSNQSYIYPLETSVSYSLKDKLK